MRYLTGLVLLVSLSGAPTALKAEQSLGGSVPCIWHIYVTISALVEGCGLPIEDDMKVALRESIGDLESYIIRNTTDSQMPTQISTEKSRLFDAYRDADGSSATCTASVEYSLYEAIVLKRSPDTIRQEIKTFLSLPREDPFEGGCL